MILQRQLKRRKNGGVKEVLRLNLELKLDYFIGGEQQLQSLLALGDFDYVIGSVHFFKWLGI